MSCARSARNRTRPANGRRRAPERDGHASASGGCIGDHGAEWELAIDRYLKLRKVEGGLSRNSFEAYSWRSAAIFANSVRGCEIALAAIDSACLTAYLEDLATREFRVTSQRRRLAGRARLSAPSGRIGKLAQDPALAVKLRAASAALAADARPPRSRGVNRRRSIPPHCAASAIARCSKSPTDAGCAYPSWSASSSIRSISKRAC